MQKKEEETSSRKRNEWLYGPGLRLMLLLMGIVLMASIYNVVFGHSHLKSAVLGGLFMAALILVPSLLVTVLQLWPLILMKFVKDSQKRKKLRKVFVYWFSSWFSDEYVEEKFDNLLLDGDLNIGFELTSVLFSMVYRFGMIFVCAILAYSISKSCVSG